MARICGKALIVDDDKDICQFLSQLMKNEGLTALVAHDGETALRMVHSQSPDVLIVDWKLPDMDGFDVLRSVKKLDEDLPVVLMSGYAAVRGAVKAIKAGAYDYVAKPFERDEMIRVALRALNERSLKRRLRYLATHIEQKSSLRETMGTSAVVSRLISEVDCVAKSNFAVIILGETGTGKEIVACAIHQVSSRPKGPFIPVDCGAIPETLLESELFGHEKGAFTGATSQMRGKFEAAIGGTLFLDEISNMPLGSQAKLLRVIQEKKVYRVGSSKPVPIDVRLVVASNQDLQALATSGSFRSDLFFRLNEFTIRVPPVRERKGDILYLAQQILDSTNAELGKGVTGFARSAIEAMLAYSWPGNVRELRSSVRRAVLLADAVITEEHLGIKQTHYRVPTNDTSAVAAPACQRTLWDNLSLKEIVHRNTIALERDVLIHVLQKTGGNKARAARLLHVDYKTIHLKVKEYGITEDEGDSHVKKG